jgi:hypothetical protein
VRGVPSQDLPLFPAADGSVVSKEKMTDTIVEAARRLGLPVIALDGSARVSGHSLRATGAQDVTYLFAWNHKEEIFKKESDYKGQWFSHVEI